MSSLRYLSLSLDAASRSRVRGNVSHRPEFALARSHESPRVTGLLSFRGDVHFLLVHRRIARSRGERQEGSARISSYPRARAHFRSCRVRLCVDCARGRNHESSSARTKFPPSFLSFALVSPSSSSSCSSSFFSPSAAISTSTLFSADCASFARDSSVEVLEKIRRRI